MSSPSPSPLSPPPILPPMYHHYPYYSPPPPPPPLAPPRSKEEDTADALKRLLQIDTQQYHSGIAVQQRLDAINIVLQTDILPMMAALDSDRQTKEKILSDLSTKMFLPPEAHRVGGMSSMPSQNRSLDKICQDVDQHIKRVFDMISPSAPAPAPAPAEVVKRIGLIFLTYLHDIKALRSLADDSCSSLIRKAGRLVESERSNKSLKIALTSANDRNRQMKEDDEIALNTIQSLRQDLRASKEQTESLAEESRQHVAKSHKTLIELKKEHDEELRVKHQRFEFVNEQYESCMKALTAANDHIRAMKSLQQEYDSLTLEYHSTLKTVDELKKDLEFVITSNGSLAKGMVDRNEEKSQLILEYTKLKGEFDTYKTTTESTTEEYELGLVKAYEEHKKHTAEIEQLKVRNAELTYISRNLLSVADNTIIDNTMTELASEVLAVKASCEETRHLLTASQQVISPYDRCVHMMAAVQSIAVSEFKWTECHIEVFPSFEMYIKLESIERWSQKWFTVYTIYRLLQYPVPEVSIPRSLPRPQAEATSPRLLIDESKKKKKKRKDPLKTFNNPGNKEQQEEEEREEQTESQQQRKRVRSIRSIPFSVSS